VINAFNIVKHFGSSMAALDNVICGDQNKSEEKSLLCLLVKELVMC
jgi:hypothetical protein